MYYYVNTEQMDNKSVFMLPITEQGWEPLICNSKYPSLFDSIYSCFKDFGVKQSKQALLTFLKLRPGCQPFFFVNKVTHMGMDIKSKFTWIKIPDGCTRIEFQLDTVGRPTSDIVFKKDQKIIQVISKHDLVPGDPTTQNWVTPLFSEWLDSLDPALNINIYTGRSDNPDIDDRDIL